MSEGAEASEPSIQQESESESEDDSDIDFDPEQIEKEIMGVRSMLRRHCGRHTVSLKARSSELKVVKLHIWNSLKSICIRIILLCTITARSEE